MEFSLSRYQCVIFTEDECELHLMNGIGFRKKIKFGIKRKSLLKSLFLAKDFNNLLLISKDEPQ